MNLLPVRPSLLPPPGVEQPIPAGVVFWWQGRPLRVVRVAGADAAAPVICEEMAAVGDGLAGQLSLWSLDVVLHVLERPFWWRGRMPRRPGVLRARERPA